MTFRHTVQLASSKLQSLSLLARLPQEQKRALPWRKTDSQVAAVFAMVMAALIGIAPEMAIAQATPIETLTPLEQIIESIIGIMTGPIATGVAIIAVASIGYMWLSGRLEMQRALVIVAGMIIIFGSANIVNALRGSTEFTGVGTIGG